MKIRILLSLLCGWVTIGCEEDSSSSQTGTTPPLNSDQNGSQTGDPSCETNTESCPTECSEVKASPYDSAESCRSESEVIYGCWDPNLAVNTDDVCLRRLSDGLVVRATGSNRFDTSVWEACDASLSQDVTTAPLCNSTGLTEGAADCPSSATECPEGCLVVEAQRYDTVAECFAAKEVVSCWPASLAITADAPCVERLSDGVRFLASTGSPFRDGEVWGECSIIGPDCAPPE